MQGDKTFICRQCDKNYETKERLRIHLKKSHPSSNADSLAPTKSKIAEEDLYELEDKIYSQFGQLVEIYGYYPQGREEEEIQDQQKFAGQANYMSNKIVRTPYEDEIDMKKEIPESIGKPHWQPLIQTLKTETLQLLSRLQLQRDHWEFFDPLDSGQNMEDQFSLMDIPKLVKNFKKKQNLKLSYPQFSIFILWLGRICKSQTWKTLYELFACITCEFQDYLLMEELPKNMNSWCRYFDDKIQCQKIQGYSLKMNINEIKEEDLRKIVNSYLIWATHFPILPRKEQSKGKEGSKKENEQKEIKLQ